jgi:hypothetical protein
MSERFADPYPDSDAMHDEYRDWLDQHTSCYHWAHETYTPIASSGRSGRGDWVRCSACHFPLYRVPVVVQTLRVAKDRL